MKQVFIIFIALSFFNPVNAQPDSAFETLIARAGLSHLQKDQKSAILYFEKAFTLKQPDALNAYKAAGAYSLDSNAKKAFYYLKRALSAGYTEADQLSLDPYFEYVRKDMPGKWKKIKRQAYKKEKQYKKTITLPALRKQVNTMAVNDQKLRYKRIQANNDSELIAINQQISESDVENGTKAKEILKQYGWPGISAIGKDAQNNFWLIVQHADRDVLFQQAALSALDSLKNTTELNPENYAFLYDRVQCNLNYKQLYGTQVTWADNGGASGFRSILKEDRVDERRRNLGLTPLKMYALTYGFTYKNISALQAAQNDSADMAYTQSLIDSAASLYAINSFQKVYDYYNKASAVSGGMSNEQTYNAATLFATIAATNNEQQYKDIALDFLNLLYLRGLLTKKASEDQSEFDILHKEPRWVDMMNSLKE